MKKLILIALLILGCSSGERPSPVFEKGEIVRIKITGERGMVTDYWCINGNLKCSVYFVRVGTGSQTVDTGVFSDTVKIDRLPEIKFQDFELEKI